NTLAARARNALATFLSLVGQLHAETGDMELAERIDHVLMRSGLREHWAKESRSGLDSESRTENLDELVSVASRFTRPDDEDSQGMTEL
ncbi:MAG: DNA helicase II, partial [Xanthomonas perforans]|nr:DNA helicase II [Xanthomonas perforans]